jgi:hypothetical protein
MQNEMHMGLSDHFDEIQHLKKNSPLKVPPATTSVPSVTADESNLDDVHGGTTKEKSKGVDKQAPKSIFEFDVAAAVKQMERIQLEEAQARNNEAGAAAETEVLVACLEHLDEVD